MSSQKKGGRPETPPEKRRPYVIRVYLNEQEMSAVTSLRRQEDRPESALGREALMAMARARGILK